MSKDSANNYASATDNKKDFMKAVRYPADKLPPLTEQDRKELAALEKMPDSSIDYSDIPPLTKESLKKGVRGMLYRLDKRSVTIRTDSDVPH